jgi:WD40 repeat protein
VATAASDIQEDAGRAQYDAFISYSRAVDGKLAPALQSALQRFAKPWYRARAKRVFRDDASLSANPGLWSSIEQALDAARYFVLLASPGAAESRWVGEEVKHWLAHKPRERLLLVLTEGEIAWDDARGDFDWERTTALPRALGGAYEEEPRYIDVRWARTHEHLSLSDPRFREAVADVAAPLHGRPKDELIGEEVRQHRRTVRLVRGAVALLAALAIAATLAAVFALQQRNTARTERDRAEEQARIATSRSLADAALQTFDEELDLALLLALQAFRLEPTAEARDAVVTAIQRSERIERTLADDADGVTRLAFRPGTAIAATVSVNGRVTLWDTRTGRQLRRLRTGEEGGASVAIRRDGLMAVGGEFSSVTLWDSKTGRRLEPLRGLEQSEIASVAFSPDERLLAAADGEGTIGIWNVGSRRLVRTLEAGVDELFDTGSGVGNVAFSPDGRTLVFAGADGGIRTWRLDSRTPQRRRLGRHGDAVQALAFAPDGRLLATGADNGTIRFWNVDAGGPVGRERRAHVRGVNGLAFSADGKRLATAGGDGTVKLWAVGATRPTTTLTGHSQPTTAVAFTPAGGALVSASDDGTLKVWNVGGSLTERLNVGRQADRVAVSPDGRTLAVGGEFGVVRFWDLASRKPLSGWLDGHPSELVTDLEFDDSGRVLASSGEDGSVLLWDVAARRRLRPLLRTDEEPLGYSDVTPLAFRPGGELLASAADESAVAFWDVRRRTRNGRRLEDLESAELSSVAISADGSTLALGSRSGELSFWDVERRGRLGGTLRARGLEGFSTIMTLAFSPDGRLLASGGDDDFVRFWDARRRRAIGEPLRGHARPVRGVAFTPDGATLASGSEDGTVRLWDVARRRPLGEPLRSGAADVTGIAISRRGDLLAAATGSPRLVLWRGTLWPTRVEQAAARLCAAAGRNLTRSEWDEFVSVVAYERVCPALPAAD